jgi:hypothetical protein
MVLSSVFFPISSIEPSFSIKLDHGAAMMLHDFYIQFIARSRAGCPRNGSFSVLEILHGLFVWIGHGQIGHWAIRSLGVVHLATGTLPRQIAGAVATGVMCSCRIIW